MKKRQVNKLEIKKSTVSAFNEVKGGRECSVLVRDTEICITRDELCPTRNEDCQDI